MTGTEDAWGERFAAFCVLAAHAGGFDNEEHLALLRAFDDLTRNKEDARRLIHAARQVRFELERAAHWAEFLISDGGGWPWK